MNKKATCTILRVFGMIFILAGLGLATFGIYSSFTLFHGILNYILIGVGAVGVLLSVILFLIAKKITKKICLKCGFDLYGCEYEWVLDSVEDEVAQSTLEGDYYSNEVAKYTITAVCPHCGKERVYRKEFTSADYRTRTYRNSNKLIDDWCKNQFGH